MNSICAFLFITASLLLNISTTTPNSNPLIGKKWRIDGNAFLSQDKTAYHLEALPNKDHFNFGHFVEFETDGTFMGYYTASCGLDCFTTIHGTYTFNEQGLLSIRVQQVEQTGYCTDSQALSFKNKHMGDFKITSNKTKKTQQLTLQRT